MRLDKLTTAFQQALNEASSLAVARDIGQRRRLGLDRDAALALDVHRVEHLRFHLAVAQATAALDDAIGQRALAMVDVGNDREIADVVHALRERSRAVGKTAKPFQRKLISRSDVKAQSAVLKLKKRHVEWMTRLPTERLATACWAFIVVKTIGLKAAPVLVFGPLRSANMNVYQQVINRLQTPRRHCRKGTQSCRDGLQMKQTVGRF